MKNNKKKIEHHSTYTLQREIEHRHQLENCALIGGIEWDIETGHFWWSSQTSRILQLEEDGSPPSLQKLIAAIHPSDQKRVQTAFEKLSHGGEKIRMHTKLLTPGGMERPVLLGAQYDGQEDKLIGYIQDYSELASERTELLDTLSKYRGVMAGAGNAIVLLSLEGDIMEGNAKAAELLEIEEKNLSQLSVEDIHRKDDLESMMASYQGILWGNTNPFQSIITGRNGKKTPVEISGRPVDIGSQKVLVIILHDISLQRQAQDALKRSEHRYRSLVDEAREGILLLDNQGVILAVNPKVCETSGLKRSDLLQKNFNDIADFDLDVSPIDLLRDSSNRHSMHMEGYIRHYNDELVPTGFNVARFDDQGQTQFIVTAYDLSDVRAGEEDRLQLQKQLFQAQKQEMLGQLAGSLAHDFNNLLSPILLISEMLMEETTEDPFLEKNLHNINQAAQRARRLVGKILDYTRPEESDRSYVDLRYELQETLELLRSSIPHTITIEDTYNDETFPCMADSDQIHQVIMNVGMNAAQAIGEEHGTIAISLERVKVDESSFLMNQYELPEGDYAHFCVIDDGPGIPLEYLDEIFDPFFTTKTQTDGSGLGLSVVSRIAANHGGTALAQNRQDRGAQISVYLPLTDKRSLS